MPPKTAEKDLPLSSADGVLRSFAIHNRIHLYLLDALSPDAWLAAPPGGKGRTLAALVSHIHGVRLMWLKAAGIKTLPPPLEKTASISEAKQALTASDLEIRNWLAPILSGTAKVSGFKPDAWAFVSYLIAHEAHHRGQLVLLAKQLGHPVDQKTSYGLWEWGVR
jgi:uncharacterized damage-inducible protein DinB